MIVQDRGGGTVQVIVIGRDATLSLVPADTPLALTVLGGTASGTIGECGELIFASGACSSSGSGTTIVCK